MSSAAATAAVPASPVAAAAPVPARAVEPISVGALMFVLVTAILVAILSLIDVLVNGWLSGLAHLAWAAGVFVIVGLSLGLVVSVVSQLRRAHATAGTAPVVSP